MLLNGATLLSEPCPYCSGVRVMKDGFALCANCGRKPEEKTIHNQPKQNEEKLPITQILEKKLETLSRELEKEKDHKKQQDILQTINSLLETIKKSKNKQ